jgi:hypothetical protein
MFICGSFCFVEAFTASREGFKAAGMPCIKYSILLE